MSQHTGRRFRPLGSHPPDPGSGEAKPPESRAIRPPENYGFAAQLLKDHRHTQSEETHMIRTTSTAAVAIVLLCASSAFAQGTAEKGKQVYADQKCSVCHSIGAAGNKKGPLDKVGATLSADDIRGWITNAPAMAAKAKAERKPVMKAYTLAKEDVDALVAYMQTLK
jgi:mono/diheme cytochrome c family protein